MVHFFAVVDPTHFVVKFLVDETICVVPTVAANKKLTFRFVSTIV